MDKTKIISLTIIFISFLVGITLYPRMPEKMASHWNVKGEVDDYLPRFWGLFLMPLISMALFLLFLLIPKIDPLRKNFEKFRKYFNLFILCLFFFLFYLYFLTILWNLGKRFNMVQFLIPAFSMLFYCIGVLLKKSKQNWFIGIRTPWTMSSEMVWQKTHKSGARLFKVAALISLLGIFFPKYAIFFVLFPAILISIYAIFYSYFQFEKETKPFKE